MSAFKISVSTAGQAALDFLAEEWEIKPVVAGKGELVNCVARLQARVKKRSETSHSFFRQLMVQHINIQLGKVLDVIV